jgi:hypothetical protein
VSGPGNGEFTDPDDQFARAAARVSVTELLAAKGHGDRITAREIVEATGIEDWRILRPAIYAWARKHQLVVFAVRNDGWRFGEPAEHSDYAESKRRRSLRAEKQGLRALLDTPPSGLNDEQRRRHEFLLPRAAARVSEAERHERETKEEFRLGGERVPRRSERPR